MAAEADKCQRNRLLRREKLCNNQKLNVAPHKMHSMGKGVARGDMEKVSVTSERRMKGRESK